MRALRLAQAPVDRQTGELQEVSIESLAAENQALRDELAELLRKFKGQSRELAALRRDRAAEAEADPLWPLAVRLFVYHNAVCNHPRAEWTAERFLMVRRRLKNPGLESCLRASAGIGCDAWRRARGLTMWEDVHGSQKNFERALAKCPPGWRPPPGAERLLTGSR
jgi:hypothetical protein